jgi:hypothetical protein
MLLIEAKRRVLSGEAGDTTWGAWFYLNIKDRTLRDGQRCMKLAGAPDPDEARAREKERHRNEERGRKTTHVSPGPVDPTIIDDDISTDQQPQALRPRRRCPPSPPLFGEVTRLDHRAVVDCRTSARRWKQFADGRINSGQSDLW